MLIEHFYKGIIKAVNLNCLTYNAFFPTLALGHNMPGSYIFTSESVSGGHPDKMADQISDAVLDALLEQDHRSRVACETLVKTGMVLLAGEITTNAEVDMEALVRKTVCDIGYDNPECGFDGKTCAVLTGLGKQSGDIAMGVDESSDKEQGAGDQGLMFGYACNDTDVLMPAPITYAHRLVRKQFELMKSGELDWLLPDAKSQVTLRYEDHKPVGIEAVVLSTQHKEEVDLGTLREAVIETILKPVLPEGWLAQCKNENIHVNPTGRFVIGGPVGDAGLAVKLSLTPMVAWRVTAAAPSRARTLPRLTARQLTPHVTWPRI